VLSDTANPGALAVAAMAGLVAATVLPLDRVGVGWLVTAAAGFVGLAGIGRHRLRWQHLWAVPAVALFGVGTVRDAVWLFVLCVFAAAGCFALATVGARTFPGMLVTVIAGPVSALRAIPWAARGVRRVRGERVGRLLRLAASAAVGIALLVVFGALFSSADPAFAKIMGTVNPHVSVDNPVRSVFLFAVFGLGTLGAAYLLVNPTTLGEVSTRVPKPVRRLEWALPVGLLVGMFGAFVAVQATVLFGDREYVMRTVGLTFAEYARRGFWQLLVVTLLTLAVIALAVRLAPRAVPADRVLLRVLLGALAFGALVVVTSALWRMNIYEQAYGYTRLRVLVSAVELALGAMFLLVVVAGVRLRFGWLPNAVAAVGVLTVLGLAALNPDRFIAAQNVARYEQIHKIDIGYLATLSSDAAPELDRLPYELRRCALWKVKVDLTEHPDNWRTYNASRARAARFVVDVDIAQAYCSG
jgi:hypothetical protein